MASDMLALKARSIAIIGGGPSGVVAAKYLRAEKAFDKIAVFEQRSRSGGIWNYTGDQRDEDLFSVPQTDPRGKNQNPVWREASKSPDGSAAINGTSGTKETASFLSPIYERLETNIPRGLMGFQGLDWPQDSQLFPKHETVLQYIEDYGKDVQDLVQYETQVTNVEPIDDSRDGAWTVLTRNLRTSSQKEEVFDAVMVANGHFIVPYVPDIAGIKEWNAKFPSAISHSKYYRRPEDFAGKKVVVVGNSASGSDISTQICQYSSHPLLWSSRSDSMFKPAPSPLKRELPPIARFLPATRGVAFEDGTIEHDIDAVVFATGYFYSLPFLENPRPKLVTDGEYVQNTYKHLFYAPRPTLAFLVLNQRVIPFPFAEAQSAVVARVYSGRLSLPTLPTMQAWERNTVEESGGGRNFHVLSFPKDANYINEMSTWALSAPPCEGLENEGKGKLPPVWGEWEYWCRENFPKIRAAFGSLGEKRFGVRTLEEVGFSYEEYQKEKAREEGKVDPGG
ncbi:flavin-containing monooxygenase [Lentithecium fluviatile CBS 122367]|uniref:Flavin-containing monooxygenase n=1 Tax=Lentithecium fluviatile CBS 122367 TaxID=1168545 RepID=A0A6G1IIA1_9PLEO|nr:flavin-containing monooxygenase [Lentithecium fluviatile CBS 122367]